MIAKRITAAALCLVLVIMSVWIWQSNSMVEVNEYVIKGDIPNGFNGFRIAQVSDLHNTNNEKIIEKLKGTNPDIIVITGDMIDSRNTKVDVAAAFAKEAVEIAPCFYVTGNHEARVRDKYSLLKEQLTSFGVTVLENEECNLSIGNESISLIGLHDTGFDFNTGIDYTLEEVNSESDNYKILLAHRPEYFNKYNGVDLILSGHAHGGQIRLPFIGGLFAPGQGLFPEYDSGIYKEDGKTMVVSRGLGNSLFPFRVNNNPEIVVVTLEKG